jgi:hypothetical protein
MKTAVEWLEDEVDRIIETYDVDMMRCYLEEAYEQAKEMEKEQMRSDFWHHRRITGYEILKDEVKTFKQQEQ